MHIIVKGENSEWFVLFLLFGVFCCCFIKKMLEIGLHSEAYEPILFELGAMIDTTELYILIPVRMTLFFTQGHRVTRKLRLVQPLCCKVV